MKYVIALLAAVVLCGMAMIIAQDKKPPEKIAFPSSKGETTFLHAKHIERENGNCKNCHDKLWPQTNEPLKNSFGCHTCHKANGKAYNAMDNANCKRCHPVSADQTAKKP